MKILVCVKQVPQIESDLKIDGDNRWIEEENLSFRMNRFDEYALEEAVLIKEQFENVTVDALSMGPERVVAVIKKALEKGADNGIHIIDENLEYTLPEVRASAIAEYALSQNYDLIFTGVMAEDDMESQVGPLLAAKLSVPCAVSIVAEEIDLEQNGIDVKSEIENGVVEEIYLSFPALITIQSGINRPRYPSLSNVLRAKRQEIIKFNLSKQSKGNDRSDISLSIPEKIKTGIIIKGTVEEKVEKLIEILHNKSLI